MQRCGMATDGEGLAIFRIDPRHQWDAGPTAVEHQRAAVGLERAADMLADTGRVGDADPVAVLRDVVGQSRNHFIAALDRRPAADAIGVGRGFRADAVERHGVAHSHRLRVVRQREQVRALGRVVAHEAPDAVPVTLKRRIEGVQVVTVGGGGTGDHRHRRHEAQLLGNSDHLRRLPARVGAVAEARAVLQPFHAVQGDVVLLLMTTSMHAQPHVVTRIGAQHRGERVARLGALVDVRRKQRGAAGRPDRRGDRRGCQVHRRDGAVGAALHGVGQVAGHAVGLHAALAIRADLVRVEHAQGQWFVAVVDDEHARVIHRDRLRARTAWAAWGQPAARLDDRFEQVGGLLPHRRVDSVAEAVSRGRISLAVRLAVRAGPTYTPAS